MSTVAAGGTWRGMRAAWVMVGLIALAMLLAGCSSSGSTADYATGGADAGGEAGAPAEEATDADGGTASQPRAFIVTGEMYMTVEDPIAAADQVATRVIAAGGRVDARSETAPDEYDGGSATMTLRIPAAELDAVVEDLRAFGTVDQLSTDSVDVTTQVQDLEARISTLRASTSRIERLLVEAEDIGDIIALESELSTRQAQLESLEAQQRGLDDQVAMSTIYLSLTTEPVVIVDDSPDSFWDGLVSGWNGLVGFFSVVLVILGTVLPWLALGGLVALVVWLVVRGRRSRAAQAAPAPAPAVQSSPAPTADAEASGD